MRHAGSIRQGGALFLVNEFPPLPGGIGNHAYSVASGLHRLGVNVRVLANGAASDSGPLHDFDAEQEFAVTRLGEERYGTVARWLRCIEIRRWCKLQNPRYLIASGTRPLWLMHRVSQRVKIPWLAMAYGSELLAKRLRRRNRTLRAYRHAQAVISISRFTTRLLEENGVEREKIKTVWPGARLSAPYSDEAALKLRQELGLSRTQRVILTVGTVSRRKGQDTIIRSLPRILREFPDTVYLIAGVPGERRAFAQLAESLGVAGHVRFLGVAPTGDLPNLYRLCDVFALTSRIDSHGNCEGFGIVYIEANLAERPVVGTLGCGAEDAVAHDVSGLLVAPESPAETAEAVLSLLRDPQLARRLGTNGRKRAMEEFGWDRVAKSVYEIVARTRLDCGGARSSGAP